MILEKILHLITVYIQLYNSTYLLEFSFSNPTLTGFLLVNKSVHCNRHWLMKLSYQYDRIFSTTFCFVALFLCVLLIDWPGWMVEILLPKRMYTRKRIKRSIGLWKSRLNRKVRKNWRMRNNKKRRKIENSAIRIGQYKGKTDDH